MNQVAEFIAQARALDLLGRIDFSVSARADELMDARESAPFDGQWMRCYSAVQDAEVERELQTKNVAIDELREWAFARALDVSSHGDVAGAVADDFELIARALQASYSDPWLGALWQTYRAGGFPPGELP